MKIPVYTVVVQSYDSEGKLVTNKETFFSLRDATYFINSLADNMPPYIGIVFDIYDK